MPLDLRAAVRVALRSTGRLITWITAHYALEWLFFATKPSVITAASNRDRLLILLATPLTVLLFAIPIQLLAGAVDGARRNARTYWLAALLPALVATIVTVIAVENFTNTVIDFGIIDTRGKWLFLYSYAVLIYCGGLLWREARLLAQPRSPWPAAASGVLLVATAVAGHVVTNAAGAPAEPSAAVPARATAAAAVRTPNILLIGMDGTTADHSSAYGYYRKTTPTLERLAARGLLFENAFANAGRTFGSLISINTGKPPTVTHTVFPPSYLQGRHTVEHLPGILRQAGYTTVQIGMRHYSDAEDWNLKGAYDLLNGRAAPDATLRPDRSETDERLRRHRDSVHDRIRERFLHLTTMKKMEDEFAFLADGEKSPYFRDERRIALATEFFVARREPWMMHLHFSDTHCCGDYGAPKVPWPDRHKKRANGYDDVFHHTDRNIARLLEVLRRTGQLERTMIIVYSDHTRLWGTIGRLPLVVVPPGGTAPRRVKANVQMIDIAPTVLDQLGLPKPEWMHGQSLLRPEQLDPLRPVISLNQLTATKQARNRRSIVIDPGPPLYGAATAAIVICDRALELRMTRPEVKLHTIKDHTAPCGAPPLDQRARTMLAEHLRANGYPADDSTPWDEAIKPVPFTRRKL